MAFNSDNLRTSWWSPNVPVIWNSKKSERWQFTTSTLFAVIFLLIFCVRTQVVAMSTEEINELRLEASDMFYHAYNAYMENAFPADELMPLSCKGRFRGREANRGDVDDTLGNFSLTLIDSLDTLVVVGDLDEFERGVKLVMDNVHFDHDIVVSVFETNIRIVGGLLSAHILAEYLHDRLHRMLWYQGELLNMAMDIGYRLLPAFNSTTGLPHPRVNLRHGLKLGTYRFIDETCTACAGTMILEFAALSRLSGEPIFEQKASKAMDVLWSSRNRMSNLVGNVLNINTGDWVRRDSGVGAGIDSYYEYVAKAYVLLGEEKYLSRWNTHYSAVMKYLGQGPLLQDVHMHRPHSTSRHFVDALGAFFPGLQVLMGDLKPAIESHEILYQIFKRHNFIPEAFTLDYQVHWGQHLLRPEFVESTYFLYRATGDHHYLDVGKEVLKGLQNHARVMCGYATIKDVRTMQLEDRMDSFVLAETFKYLYLLFANDSDMVINVDQFVFTTEGHLLPLSLARLSNRTAVPLGQHGEEAYDEDVEFSRACPSTDYLFPGNKNFAESLRSPFAKHVEEKCPLKPKVIKRRLLGSDFQSNNAEHLKLIKNMGISIVNLSDGRVQLLHSFANAKTTEDGEEGLLFMQEMIELSKQQNSQPETPPKVVSYEVEGIKKTLFAGPAQFGRQLADGFTVSGQLVIADPYNGCTPVMNGQKFWGKIGVVQRGDCMFVEKARNIEGVGAKGLIVIDHNDGTTAASTPLFAMSGDGTDDISIPVVLLFSEDAKDLLAASELNPSLEVQLQDAFDLTKSSIVDTTDDDVGFDLTSPVSSFLEHSKRQVEKYLRSFLKADTDDEVEQEHDEIVTVVEKESKSRSYTDTKTQVSIESVDKNGEPTFIKVEKIPIVEPTQTTENDSHGTDVKSIPPAAELNGDEAVPTGYQLEDFLHPESSSVRRLIEHHVLKNPNMLTELLSVQFSDLLKVFKDLFENEASGSIEAAYLKLFQMLDEGGSEYVTKKSKELGGADSHRPQLLSNVLDDKSLSKLLDETVTAVASNEDELHQKKVKAASIVNLLNVDFAEHLSLHKKDKPKDEL